VSLKFFGEKKFYTKKVTKLLDLAVVHWTSETWCECSEIAGSPQGSPPVDDYVSCEAGRRNGSEHETGTEELCEIKWDYHIVGMRA
jgi:hypothetical protein